MLCKKEQRESVFPFPTLLHDINGTSVRSGKVLNIAPGENQILVSFTQEPDWEALAFVKQFPLGIGPFNKEKHVQITPSQYVHARLKMADDRFASNARYVFAELDMIERVAILSSTIFAENKRFQDNVTVRQVNSLCTRCMLSEQQICYSFKNICGTPQYKHHQLLDV